MTGSGVLDIATLAVRMLNLWLIAVTLLFCVVIRRRGLMKRSSLTPLVVGLSLSFAYRVYVLLAFDMRVIASPADTDFVAFANNAVSLFTMGAIAFYAWVVASGRAHAL
jgi:hypothetical protein